MEPTDVSAHGYPCRTRRGQSNVLSGKSCHWLSLNWSTASLSPVCPWSSLLSWLVWHQLLQVEKTMITLLWKLKLNNQHRDTIDLKEPIDILKARAGNTGLQSQKSRSTFPGPGTKTCRRGLVARDVISLVCSWCHVISVCCDPVHLWWAILTSKVNIYVCIHNMIMPYSNPMSGVLRINTFWKQNNSLNWQFRHVTPTLPN